MSASTANWGNYFGNLPIAKKVAIIPALLLLMFVLVGAIVYIDVKDVDRNVDVITKEAVPVVGLASELITNIESTGALLNHYLHSHSSDDLLLLDLKIEQQNWFLTELGDQVLTEQQSAQLEKFVVLYRSYTDLVLHQLPDDLQQIDNTIFELEQVKGPVLAQALTDLAILAAQNRHQDISLEVASIKQHLDSTRYHIAVYTTSGRSENIMRAELEVMASREAMNYLKDSIGHYQFTPAGDRYSEWSAIVDGTLGEFEVAVKRLKKLMKHEKQLLEKDIPGLTVELEQTALRLQEVARVTTEQASDTAHASLDEMINFTSVLLLGAVIVGISVSVVVIRLITRPVTALSNLMLNVSNSGDLSQRADVSTSDELGQAGSALNTMLDQQQSAIKSVEHVVSALKGGDFSARVDADLKGDLANLKEGVNGSSQSIERSMASVMRMMEALQQGDFKRVTDVAGFEGDFQSVIQMANRTMEILDVAIADVCQVMNAAAKGDFDRRVTAETSGQLSVLKDDINASMNALEDAIKQITIVTSGMSEGDLSQRIERKHQGQLGMITDSMATTIQKLGQMVGEVRAMAQDVRTGANNISKSGGDLTYRISEQAASLEETSASMEEMASTVEQNAEHADSANKMMQESLREANEGINVVSRAEEAVGMIEESSRQISEITTLIDGIAFQTNLLALNAAVEAARAGDHGRGFAVVAGEVRILAQRTTEAAKEISALIGDSSKRVSEGNRLVHQTGLALEKIQGSVKSVGETVTQISVAGNEQTAGINQVNLAVAQLDQLNQQNAGLVDDSARAGRALDQQAAELTRLMDYFKLDQSDLQRAVETVAEQVDAEAQLEEGAPVLEEV
ncbi:MAG: methyl-accepting chemotaxis protein [Chromatiales bacterium]|nr:methyl-accepting chemotaxis protein [Chromatiales bacterium]